MKNKWIWIGIILVVIIGVGGKLYMNKAAKEKQQEELHDRQVDLANYIFNNYQLYTVDVEKDKKLNQEYNRGNGTLTTADFLRKSDELKEYSNVEKIEFTGFSVGPMNNLEVHYTINDVIHKKTSLDTISAETNKFLYGIGEHSGEGPYYLEKKEDVTNFLIPDELVVYYHGGID